MLSTDVLWGASEARAKNWIKTKSGPVKMMGDSPLSSGSSFMKDSSLSAANRAMPSLMGPLDILMSEVPNAMSAASAQNDSASSLNLSNVFSDALTPSPFQKTSMTITPPEVAGTFMKLATGIYRTAAASSYLAQEQKDELFTDIAAGVNLGFESTRALLSEKGALTTDVEALIARIQSSVRDGFSAFYTREAFSGPHTSATPYEENEDADFYPVDTAPAADTSETQTTETTDNSAPPDAATETTRQKDTWHKYRAVGSYINPKYL